MREIKFQFIYKGLPHSAENKEFNWHKKVYSIETLISERLSEICDVHNTCELIAVREFTGLTDKNGAEIYEGDLIRNDVGRVAAVYFHELTAQFDCTFVSDDLSIGNPATDRSYGFNTFLWDRSVEVIANVHENPELLGGEE